MICPCSIAIEVSPMTGLFRKEAVVHATQRLPGAVVLAAPLSVRTLGLGLSVVVFAAVVFASMATYARRATVTGWLVPDQGLIRATVSSGGFIESVAIREGDVVAKGAKLVEIRIGSETASGNVGEEVMRQLRTEAEAAQARARTLIERLHAEAGQATDRLSRLRLELQQSEIQKGLQEQRLRLAREELGRAEEIAAKGFMARRELDARRSAALMTEQELVGQRRQSMSLDRDIADVQARLSTIAIEKETAAAESRSAAANLQRRIIDAEAHRVQLVVSPVAGRVAALPVVAGQPVSPGATVAVVVPAAAKLEAELLAPSRAAGFIRAGQEVQLMLQAFPYQRFGTLRGEIKTISNTVLGPTEISIPGLSIQEPVFRVRVSLTRDNVEAYGEQIPFQPGMLLSADIVFDRRSLVEWLFDPLFAVAR
jgi:membrane fusion protein